MADKFLKFYTDLNAPYTNAFSITANNDTNAVFTQPTRAVSVAGSGLANVRFVDGATVEIYLSNTDIHTIRIDRVNQTNTTATGIVGLY